ncbi:MAG: 5-oxoprolinase subunit PxpA [Treponema sp.]|nr:5-oxoprolinase subunit PxpA [Spirochaetia bacterium]MDD7458926.1 5-oxoprolinase subunit PxpA [Spirochaetales bacterium]MDY5810863.1 5-oxoprolinase subunit PxpA [Treponema sp.]
MKIDLNCDLGESFGNYTIGLDSEVIKFISSANIACGFHASDPLVMAKTVKMAKENKVSVGAHPGYPDLVGFGRRNLNVSVPELKAMIQYQIGALNAFCRAEGIKLRHVKPHGAMYNMAAKDYNLALGIAEGIAAVDPSLILLGLSGSQLLRAAKEVGLPCASEVFADRAYEEDGSLVARSKPGSVITDENEAIERVITMVKHSKVKAITGREIPIQPDSVCVHGDNPKALGFVKLIRKRLLQEQIDVVCI